MDRNRSNADGGPGGIERRRQVANADQWGTAITRIAPNEIEIRGYPVDELMGRLTFSEAVYLLLRGELPTPAIGKLFGAVLVSSIDHGVTPPSTLAARNVATSGAPLRDSVAAGILAFGTYHGGDIENCMRCLQEGLAIHRSGVSYEDTARQLLEKWNAHGPNPPGFGHRTHTRDPRAGRLLQLAHELELDGEHCRFLRVVERVISAMPGRAQHPLPLNIDGAIAAVCADLGFDPDIGNGLFIIARVPGFLAHAVEERARHQPLRRIDPKDAHYDGPARRRLPETRK
jgi:citrate synthase